MPYRSTLVPADKKLVSVRPDYRTRRQEGVAYAYICYDRSGRIFIAQKLTVLRDAINGACNFGPLERGSGSDRITVTALYNNTLRDGNQRIKHTWRCIQVPLDEAAQNFELLRREHGKVRAAVLTNNPFSASYSPMD